MEATSDEAKASKTSATILSSRLIHQCRLLLAELDVFQNAIASRFRRHQQQQHLVEMRLLRSNVASELKTLERLVADTETLIEERNAKQGVSSGDGSDADFEMREGRILHTLRSSNLPFLVAVWTIAKQHCQDLVAFSKRFYWDSHNIRSVSRSDMTEDRDSEQRTTKVPNKDKRRSAFVDIVYGNGEDWLKVSTVSESRLLFEMAEKGWEMDNDDDDEYDDAQRKRLLEGQEEDEKDDDDELELIKMANDMIKAARATRVRYRNPRVHIMAPKLEEGKIPEIDKILNTIRSYGVTIQCGIKIPDVISDETIDERDPGSISETDLPLSAMLPDPFKDFTSTINVDCTLLLAVVSDLSHKQNIAPSPRYHRAIIRQIEVEEELPLLTAELWPAMVGRQLICTQEAVKRMKEIVNTIGTESERQRTAIFLGEGDSAGLENDTLLRRFRETSDHPIPDQLQIPIKTVEARAVIDTAMQQHEYPPLIHKVTEILTDINRSVFLYGWAKDIVTITSNRTVVKQIENIIEDNRGDDDTMEGPKIWVCDTARSLIGKDKNRKS